MVLRTLLSLAALSFAAAASGQKLECPAPAAPAQQCETFHYHVLMYRPDARTFAEIVGTPQVKFFGFVEMIVFLAILVVGYIYAWAKGALDWE